MKGARALASGMLVLALSCAIPAVSAAQDAGTTTDATTTTTTTPAPVPPPPADTAEPASEASAARGAADGAGRGNSERGRRQLRRDAHATRPRVARDGSGGGAHKSASASVTMGDFFFSPASVSDRRRRHGHLAQHRSGAAQRHGRRRQLQDARSEQRAERLPHLQSGRDLQLHLHDPPEHEGDGPGAELEQRRRRRGWRFLVGLERLGELRGVRGRLAGCRRQLQHAADDRHGRRRTRARRLRAAGPRA